MEWIKDKNKFHVEKWKWSQVFEEKEGFPKQIFKKQYRSFLFFECDRYTMGGFWGRLIDLGRKTQEEQFVFGVIDPDPEAYFYKHFKRFPFFGFSSSDSEKEWIKFLNEDPGGSPADCANGNCNRYIIYPDGLSWAIWGDRDFEISAVGYIEKETMESVKEAFGLELVYSAQEVVDLIFSRDYYKPGFKERVEKQFIQNYGS